MNRFMGITILLSVLIILYVQAAPTDKEIEEKYKKAVTECAAEHGLDIDIVQKEGLSSEAKEPKKTACAKKCTMMKMGYLNDDATLKEDAFLADSSDMLPEHANIFKDCLNNNAKKVVADCGNYVEVEKCLMEKFTKQS